MLEQSLWKLSGTDILNQQAISLLSLWSPGELSLRDKYNYSQPQKTANTPNSTSRINRKTNYSEVAQSCLTLCNPMDCNLPGSSVHGIFQARVLEWVAISFSRGSSWPWDWTQVSHIAGRHFTLWATREAKISGSFILTVHKLATPLSLGFFHL